MTKTIAVILVTLFSVACGGEPFNATEFSAVGGEAPVGDAGATDAAGGQPAAFAGASHGGSPGDAGSSASAGSVGVAGSSVTGGTASAGGDGPDACPLDVAKLTAALPKAFTWKDFSVAEGSVCASCTYEPCSQLAPTWGEPSVLGDHVVYKPTYKPTTSVPLLVHVTKNDGACSGGIQCELKPATVSVGFSMTRKGDAWQAAEVSAFVSFAANDCMNGIGDPDELTGPVAADLQQEIQASVIGLQIPCN